MTQPRRHNASVTEEQSGVRLRGAETAPASRGSERPPDRPREVARCERIEQKVRMGQVVLDALPSGDTRARLLRTALVRRDEVLIDAVLAQLRMLT